MVARPVVIRGEWQRGGIGGPAKARRRPLPGRFTSTVAFGEAGLSPAFGTTTLGSSAPDLA